MKKSFIESHLERSRSDVVCQCLTDCIDKTDKFDELSVVNPQFFSAKARQFFLLLPNDDWISKKAKSHLLSQVPLKDMLEAGLIKQTKSCDNFQTMLLANTADDMIENNETQEISLKPAEPSQPIDPILQVIANNYL